MTSIGGYGGEHALNFRDLPHSQRMEKAEEMSETNDTETESSIIFNILNDPPIEVLRLDEHGMLYKGVRVEDAGEAYIAFMKAMDAVNKGWTHFVGTVRLRSAIAEVKCPCGEILFVDGEDGPDDTVCKGCGRKYQLYTRVEMARSTEQGK